MTVKQAAPSALLLTAPGCPHCPGMKRVLEKLLDELNGNLPALQDFVLPGGTPGAAACHFAWTVCRRAERRAGAEVVGGL